MQVKLLVSRAGANFSQSPGEIIDVGEAEGGRMIAAGQAEPVGETVTNPQTPAQPDEPQRQDATETATRKRHGERAVRN